MDAFWAAYGIPPLMNDPGPVRTNRPSTCGVPLRFERSKPIDHFESKLHNAIHGAMVRRSRSRWGDLRHTLEIHALELGWYNLQEADLPTASPLDRWIFWLMHAHEYYRETPLKLLPDQAFQMATSTLTRISGITQDKQMYDSREKAIRDQQWALYASRNEGIIEGEIKGEIKLIRALEKILQFPTSSENDLVGKSLEELQSIATTLQSRIRSRSI